MSTKRNVMALAKRTALVAMLGWLVAAGLRPAGVQAQLPLQPVGTPFEMTGFIQKATLDNPNDLFSGGTITVNNHLVIVPRNTILQMPAAALTWNEVFKLAPPPYGPTQSGLALADVPKPGRTYEVVVQGNRVEPGGAYVAGLLFLAQQSLKVTDGYINFIDYTTGELRVGGTPGVATTGTRVRINDPIGRFGRAQSPDVRFSIDENNPTIKTETAYPMCVPRTDPFLVADDPLCPQGNRPAVSQGSVRIFQMPVRPAPLPGENLVTRATPDPWRMAPFEVGDHIVYKGIVLTDAIGEYVSVWGIDGNVGLFTTQGSQPQYVASWVASGPGSSMQ